MSALISASAPSRRALNALHYTSISPLSSFFLSSRPSPFLSSSHGSSFSTSQTRSSAHASQGRANRAKRGPGKRLGLKKGASEPVVPGNIIFRQRGTGWFAGENCVMGRDHTINATQPGFVRYYKDPARHPTRKFIGVVLRQEETLPRPLGAARRRRLGLVARPISSSSESYTITPPSSFSLSEDGTRLTSIPTDKKFDAAGKEALGIPLPRSFKERNPMAALAGKTMSNAEIGALMDRVSAKLKHKSKIRAKTKLRIFRGRLNVRKKRIQRRTEGKADKSEALRDKERREKRRAKSRHRARR